MGCSPQSEVTWGVVRDLASQVDTLSTTVKSANYSKILDRTSEPWEFAGVYTATIGMFFDLSPGTIEVTDAYITGSYWGSSPFSLPDVLATLADAGDLFFVMEEDGCLCKSIFRVDNATNGYTLKEQSGTGCCQSVYVPDTGDLLDETQHIIPGLVKFWASNGSPGLVQLEVATCRVLAGNTVLTFSGVAPEDPLIHAARKMTGYFTWRIKANYMQIIWNALLSILKCANSGGARKDTVKKDGTQGFIKEHCAVTIGDVIWNQRQAGALPEIPGCVKKDEFAWYTPTCEGEACEGKGPKFYCETVLQIEQLVNAIPSYVHTRGATHKCLSTCACDYEVEWESKVGFAGACCVGHHDPNSYPGDTICYISSVSSGTCTVRDYEKDPPEEVVVCSGVTWFIVSPFFVKWHTGQARPSCTVLESPLDPCVAACDDAGGAFYGVISYAENSTTCQSLVSYARAEAKAVTEWAPGGGAGASGSLFSAAVSLGRWRLRMTTPLDCAAAGPFTRRVAKSGNIGSEPYGPDFENVSLTHHGGVGGGFYSPWVEEKFGDSGACEPQGISKGVVYAPLPGTANDCPPGCIPPEV